MPRVRWQGTEFRASVVEGLPNGNYRMMAQEDTARVAAGTIIEVKPEEIIAAEVGGVSFALAGAGVRTDATGAAQPSRPAVTAPLTPDPPSAPPQSKAKPMPVTAQTPKLNGLPNAFASFIARVEAAAGKVHDKMNSVAGETESAVTKFSGAIDPIAAMAKQIDDTANQLTNGGPPLGNSSGQSGA